jgi:Arm DNA-binding domain
MASTRDDSVLEIRAAKSGARLVKLSDDGGLQLWVMPDTAKRWRLAYRFAGNQKTLAIGVYPAIGLREARDAREAAKRLLSAGQDPSLAKRLAKSVRATASANTFDAIARELVDKKRREAKAEGTLAQLEWRLSLARPAIGARPIAEITAPEILGVLRSVESRGRHETARRLCATIGEVFRYAVATGRADTDPTGALKGALTAPTIQHRAAIIEPKAFGGLLRAIETYEGAPETRAALELLALTFVRGCLVDPRRKNEDEARAPRSARPARHRHLAGSPDDYGPWKVPFPVYPLGFALHEREHDQRCASSSRLRQGRNDRPWFSVGRVLDAERKRPMERGRDRAATRSCR